VGGVRHPQHTITHPQEHKTTVLRVSGVTITHPQEHKSTVLRVSGVTITHTQGHKTTVTTASGNRYTVLLFVATVEELELI
jgi:hypothetical protein